MVRCLVNGMIMADFWIIKFQFVSENMIIQQIRNATLKIEYNGISFLIDP